MTAALTISRDQTECVVWDLLCLDFLVEFLFVIIISLVPVCVFSARWLADWLDDRLYERLIYHIICLVFFSIARMFGFE